MGKMCNSFWIIFVWVTWHCTCDLLVPSSSFSKKKNLFIFMNEGKNSCCDDNGRVIKILSGAFLINCKKLITENMFALKV